MNRTPRIAGAGICLLDHIIIAPQADWGETARVSKYVAQGGGLVGTAIVAAARLGAECELFSLLGDDPVADQVLAGFREEGVGTAGVPRLAGGGSPFSFIHVGETTGERTIFFRPGVNLSWPSEREIDLSGFDALLLDDLYPDLSIAACNSARAAGVPIVSDVTAYAPNPEILAQVDVLIAPRHFARHLGLEGELDTALDAIHKMGPTTAIITLGSEGWVFSDPKGRGRGNAFPVEVADTTGAGDAFHGAFAFALAQGWDTNRCCEFSAAVSALKCTKPGGRTGLPSLRQTLEFLKDRGAA